MTGSAKQELALYGELFEEIKGRIRAAQNRAARAVNAELTHLYWDIGRMIAARQAREGWGASIVARLARDLRNELPEQKGFSERNLWLMLQFAKTHPVLFEFLQQPVAELVGPAETNPIGQQAVAQSAAAQIPWGHNALLLQKIKTVQIREWYGGTLEDARTAGAHRSR